MFSKYFIYIFRVTFCVALIVTFSLSVVKVDQSLPGGFNDKFYHGLAFFVLSFLLNFSFPKSGFKYYSYLPLFSYGVLIEVVQFFLPYRSFSIADMIADAAGIFLYYIFYKTIIVDINRRMGVKRQLP